MPLTPDLGVDAVVLGTISQMYWALRSPSTWLGKLRQMDEWLSTEQLPPDEYDLYRLARGHVYRPTPRKYKLTGA